MPDTFDDWPIELKELKKIHSHPSFKAALCGGHDEEFNRFLQCIFLEIFKCCLKELPGM